MESDPFDDVVIVPYLQTGATPAREEAPSKPMLVEPTCRYGHGALEAQEPHYSLDRLARTTLTDSGELRFHHGRGGFRVSLWRCPVCRYLEMFDPD